MHRKAQGTMYYVRDLDRAVEFHTRVLGHVLLRRLEWGYAHLDVDGRGGRIGLFSLEMYAREMGVTVEGAGHPPARLVVQVADLEAEVSRLRSAGVRTTGICGEKGAARSAHIFDDEGNALFYWEDGTGTVEGDGG